MIPQYAGDKTLSEIPSTTPLYPHVCGPDPALGLYGWDLLP
jgi:hypothetical protein